MKQFSEMNLKPGLVKALTKINFITATDVQEQVIPIALEGKDIIVRAKTGTGKTCSFLIPILQKMVEARSPVALIIAPTRELALQIFDVVNKIKQDKSNTVIVYGGASVNTQMYNLRQNPSIVIGTPGRIIDLVERRALRLNDLKFLILDEADTMLDMGFLEDIEFIMSKTPSSKQTMLFSATIPEEIKTTAKKHLHAPLFLSIGEEEELKIPTNIKHYYATAPSKLKFAVMLAYINKYNPKKAIIFVHTKYAANEIYEALKNQGIHAILLHGGLTQSKREISLNNFRAGAKFLIATNIASRGLDIGGISDIINFDAPDNPNIYIHRVGRSARMNANGLAFTIVESKQRNFVSDIEYAINIKIERLFLDASKYANIQLFKSQNNNNSRYKSTKFHQTPQHQNYKKDQYRRGDNKKIRRNKY